MAEDLTTIVQAILRSSAEERGVDFKGPDTWDATKFKLARGCLAMSNLAFDGYLVVGVEEVSPNKFKLRGLKKTVLETYRPDEVQDFLTSFLDPPVSIRAAAVKFERKTYFVVQVGYQGRTAVKAKKSNSGKGQDQIDRGCIYYRPKGVRPQSRVAQPEDIEDLVRDLVDAQLKEWGRQTQLTGLLNSPAAVIEKSEDKFKSERGGFA